MTTMNSEKSTQSAQSENSENSEKNAQATKSGQTSQSGKGPGTGKQKLDFVLRCLAFCLGMFIMACGIATITNADLGTTPITSIPYAVNALFPLTIGVYTGGINACFVLLQKLVLGREFRLIHALQLPPVLFFGMCIDFWMHCTSFIVALPYAERMLFLCAGIVIMAIGILIEVASHVIVLPGEGIVMAIAYKTRRNFGTIKVLCDVSMVCIAMVIGFTGLGHIVGIREGTVMSAVFTGFVVRFFSFLVRTIWPQRAKK